MLPIAGKIGCVDALGVALMGIQGCKLGLSDLEDGEQTQSVSKIIMMIKQK